MPPPRPGCCRRTQAESSSRGPFAGFPLRIIKVTPVCAIMAHTYEFGKSFPRGSARNSPWARERMEGMRARFLPWVGCGRRTPSQVLCPQGRGLVFSPLSTRSPRSCGLPLWAHPGPPQTAFFLLVLTPKLQGHHFPLHPPSSRPNLLTPSPHFPVCCCSWACLQRHKALRRALSEPTC